MTTQEMHIGIDLDLQEINSQVTKDILPQEKDWFLNREVHKFISQRERKTSNSKAKGFQDNAKRVEDLKDLIKVETLYPVNSQNTSEVKEYLLPSDYFDYIRFDGLVSKNCTSIEIQNSTITKYKTTFKLNIDNDATLDSFSITALDGGVVKTLFNIDDLPDNYLTNEEFRKQKFLLIKALKVQLDTAINDKIETSPKFSLYWEYFGYDYISETFILITEKQLTNITVNVNGTATVNVTEEFSYVTKSPLSLKSVVRVIDEEFDTHVNNSSLSKSRSNSLTASIRKNVLIVNEPKSVIVGELKCAYICTPNLIDLYLNSNLNMSRPICEEIVSNTVRMIKAIIQDGNYEAYVRENMLIE